jgi:hypothetical protein
MYRLRRKTTPKPLRFPHPHVALSQRLPARDEKKAGASAPALGEDTGRLSPD